MQMIWIRQFIVFQVIYKEKKRKEKKRKEKNKQSLTKRKTRTILKSHGKASNKNNEF